MSGAFDDSPGGPVGNSPGGPGAAGFASPARRPSSMRPRADSGSNGNGASSSSGVGFGSLAKRNAEGSPDAPGVVGLTNLGNTCYMNSVNLHTKRRNKRTQTLLKFTRMKGNAALYVMSCEKIDVGHYLVGSILYFFVLFPSTV